MTTGLPSLLLRSTSLKVSRYRKRMVSPTPITFWNDYTATGELRIQISLDMRKQANPLAAEHHQGEYRTTTAPGSHFGGLYVDHARIGAFDRGRADALFARAGEESGSVQQPLGGPECGCSSSSTDSSSAAPSTSRS
jgi:hypothetical protein